MILDIVSIFLDLLPELILGAGPFCVFKGMGTGKDSGKLLFKKIYSDGGLTITEDSTSLDLTSVGGSGQIPIDSFEIAFGNPSSTGLTSSTFKVDGWSYFNNRDSILGMSIIGGSNHENRSGVSAVSPGHRTSVILGGSGSWITASVCSSAIAGGHLNCIDGENSSCFNAVVGSFAAEIYGSSFSTIIGSYIGNLNFSNSSSIVSSRSSTLNLSTNSIILGSFDSQLNNSTQSTIMMSYKGQIEEGISTSISGSYNFIYKSKFSTNLNGYKNYTKYSECSTIFNGNKNCMSCVSKSSIINGVKNYLCSLEPRFMNSMTIVNGYKNFVVNYSRSTNRPYNHQFSTIINGQYNKFCDGSDEDTFSCYDTIINGRCNTVSGQFNTIINGYKNCVGRAKVNGRDISTIISGNNSLICGNGSTSFTSRDQCTVINNSNHSVIFNFDQPNIDPGRFSVISGDKFNYNSIFGSIGRGQRICSGTSSSDPTKPLKLTEVSTNNSIFTIQANSILREANIIGNATFSLNYDASKGVTLSNINNTIISIGSSMSALYSSTSQYPGRGLTISNSAIVGGFYHNMVSAIDSVILSGCCNRIVEACRSSIIGGFCNNINGFCKADAKSVFQKAGVRNSVILGGYKNLIGGIKPVENSVIIGGKNLYICEEETVLVQNMALYGSVGYYNFSTKTLSNGIDASKSGVINSLTVCHGIIVALT